MAGEAGEDHVLESSTQKCQYGSIGLFSTLSAKLRNKIYSFTFATHSTQHDIATILRPPVAILKTNIFLQAEASGMCKLAWRRFSEEDQFELSISAIDDDGEDLIRSLSAKALGRIKNLQIRVFDEDAPPAFDRVYRCHVPMRFELMGPTEDGSCLWHHGHHYRGQLRMFIKYIKPAGGSRNEHRLDIFGLATVDEPSRTAVLLYGDMAQYHTVESSAVPILDQLLYMYKLAKNHWGPEEDWDWRVAYRVLAVENYPGWDPSRT